MNIKTRLSIQFTLLVFGILVFFSVLVYYFSYTSQLSKFRNDLLVKAQNTAILLINVAEVDSTLLKKIHQTTQSLEQEEIALTDSMNKVIYNYRIHSLTDYILSHIPAEPISYYFSIADKDGVSYKHIENNQTYHVFVIAHDKVRADNLRSLRSVLLWSILFSLWLSVTASYFFSKIAIKPISNIISKVKEINSLKLNSRLNEGKRQDEIEQLAITFNQMLSDLEQVFKSQEEFVSNASHELRTPMAIMIAESDYMLSRERKTEEYTSHLQKLTNDLRGQNQLLNSLLELAQINRDNAISLRDLRIDELIFSAIQSVKVKYPGRKILPKIDYSDNENDLLISGHAGLLEIAIKNLIDNACKFSTSDVDVKIEIDPDRLTLSISDRGVGIPKNEVDTIFKPFKRGTNVRYIGGFGIGLSIVAKIIELHHADIQVKSIENEGTSVEIRFSKEVV
ncbi:MAG: HAMP domain-containing sensor histidine kinase [Bacteroidota bacterium]|nr:HAMP domain-containing sensor histidine kinase [Bacteroidota bacterium]